MLSETQIEKLQKTGSEDSVLSPVFSALSDSGRLQIFKILLKHNNICVSDVAGILKISVPAASRQLKILETAGLIEKTRNGQMMCFSIKENNNKIKAIVDII